MTRKPLGILGFVILLLCTVSCSSTLKYVASDGTVYTGEAAIAAMKGTKESAPMSTPVKNETQADSFEPVLRFAVASDIHLLADGEKATGVVVASTPEERQENFQDILDMFSRTYDYASSSSYKGFDAIVFAGDMTDDGTEAQYQQFFNLVSQGVKPGTQVLSTLGNHAWYSTGESGSSNNNNSKTYARFEKYTGHVPDTVAVINGFYFIGLAMDIQGGRGYSAAKGAWLKEQLELAKKADPTGRKPIFVYTHIGPSNTAYGTMSNTNGVSGSYTVAQLDKVLKDYPQVVLFAGHSHRPASDPASISQKDCTVIATGTMAYSETNIFKNGTTQEGVLPTNANGGYHTTGGGDYYNEYNDKDMSVYLIIEVDKDNRVRVRYYDLKSDSFLGEPVVIDSIGNKGAFTFTSARKGQVKAPSFASDAKMTLLRSLEGSLELSFPQAQSEAAVRNYRVEAYMDGVLVWRDYRLSLSYMNPMPERLVCPLSGLQADTVYEVRIYPVDTYGNWGEPLVGSFRTAKATGQPDILDVEFKANGKAVNKVTGEDIPSSGSVSTRKDDQLGTYVADFAGKGAFEWDGIANCYELLDHAFTMEIVCKVQKAPSSSYVDIVSNQEHGGMGFEYTSDGNVAFYMRSDAKNDWFKPSVKMPTGEYVTLVAVFDGETLKLYLNGSLVSQEKVEGILWPPLKSSTRYLAIGGDSGLSHATESMMTGTVAAVRIYSYAKHI